MARFFVLYPPRRREQALLDVMRLLCAPHVQSHAHITVRGPYAAKPLDSRDWRKVTNIRVTVAGVGTFFEGKQNTVFLRCESPDLPSIWWKRDYKDGLPHITIYDGPSRQFAESVVRILEAETWNFMFVADRLREYVSTGRQNSLDIKWPEYVSIFDQVFGFMVTRDDLRTLSEAE